MMKCLRSGLDKPRAQHTRFIILDYYIFIFLSFSLNAAKVAWSLFISFFLLLFLLILRLVFLYFIWCGTSCHWSVCVCVCVCMYSFNIILESRLYPFCFELVQLKFDCDFLASRLYLNYNLFTLIFQPNYGRFSSPWLLSFS